MINVNLLPKNLRRVREPGYWKLLAIAFPLLVVGVALTLQLLAVRTVSNLEADVANREAQVQLLQPFIDERTALVARQRPPPTSTPWPSSCARWRPPPTSGCCSRTRRRSRIPAPSSTP